MIACPTCGAAMVQHSYRQKQELTFGYYCDQTKCPIQDHNTISFHDKNVISYTYRYWFERPYVVEITGYSGGGTFLVTSIPRAFVKVEDVRYDEGVKQTTARVPFVPITGERLAEQFRCIIEQYIDLPRFKRFLPLT